MSEARYIKNPDNGVVFVYTDLLAQRPGFFECDLEGKPIVKEAPKPEPKPEPKPAPKPAKKKVSKKFVSKGLATEE